jgi:deoxycytidine triphosphate deaminase
MTIKSDRWIQQMAETQSMISPFEAGQIRDRDGEKLISYGTSSYGYDVRCADEFKVFTNIPAKIYANEGVAQMLFFQSDERCLTTYRDRGGKYQGQTGVTLPKA